MTKVEEVGLKLDGFSQRECRFFFIGCSTEFSEKTFIWTKDKRLYVIPCKSHVENFENCAKLKSKGTWHEYE